MIFHLRFSLDTDLSVNEVLGVLAANISGFEKQASHSGRSELFNFIVYGNDCAFEGDVKDRELGFLYFPIYVEARSSVAGPDFGAYYLSVKKLTQLLKAHCQQLHVEGPQDDLIDYISDLGGVLT